MKKHISRLLALAMLISVAIGLRAERVVDMPDFECRKSHVLTVERITLSDNETRVDFRVEAKKGYKGTVGDNSRLRDIITGNCYYPTRAEGVKFNETIRIPAEGYIRYSLFYPPLPDSVKAIDFIEGSCDIFGLRLFGKKAAETEKIFTDEYFVRKATEMEALGAKIITLKDMAGLVNPLRAASIISKLKASVKVPVDFHTHCTPGYGLASSLMAILNGVDILDTNIWWFGGGSAAPAIELVYVFCKQLGIEVEANMEAVGEIRTRLLGARESLKAFDLGKMPKPFDPLKDVLPAQVDTLFDTAIAAARNGDEDALLEACHAIEEYFGFPKPNEIVKNAEVPGGMYSNMVAQLKALGASDLLNDAMALIPMVRRDAGLVPLVTPTSQIVGSQAVSVALDRKKGQPDYSNPSNQFISLVKGEYGHTPVPVDPAFREKITGSPVEKPYDVSSYRKPQNPTLDEFGGAPLAKNKEEELLLELLPTVANTFLRKRREEEYKTTAPAPEVKREEAGAAPEEPVTGPTLKAPMGGRIISIDVKPGDAVSKGKLLLVYEAMKMENDVTAEFDAVVKRIFVKPNDVVGTDAVLIEFEE